MRIAARRSPKRAPTVRQDTAGKTMTCLSADLYCQRFETMTAMPASDDRSVIRPMTGRLPI